MPDMITRCPKCATAFRISDTLLKSAKGMVRCGSCLYVFNASEHLRPKPAQPSEEDGRGLGANTAAFIDETRPLEQAEPSLYHKAPPADYRAVVQTVPISITGFLKQQDGTTPESNIAMPDTRQNGENGGGLFERTAAGKTLQEEEDDDLDPDDDEAWALELLKDDSDLNVQFKKITEKPKPVAPSDLPESSPESAAEIDAYSATETAPLHGEPPESAETVEVEADLSPGHEEGEHIYPDDFLDDALLVPANSEQEVAHIDEQVPDLAADLSPSTPVEHHAPAPEKPEETADDEAEIANKRQQEAVLPQRATARAKAKPAVAPGQDRGISIHDAIASIEPEPLEVDWEPSPNWKKRLLWPALALAALLLLLGQVAWLEYHRLNRIEPYRSIYAFACQYLNCTLPDLIDRSKIQTSNLVVRSHPKVENALMVDVILRNNADFEQTFPSLLLTFSNLRNEPVASRRLTPDQYLGGEMAGSKVMPIKQPIHIGLEIADPGKEAVSYSVAIVD